jgi:hypothetical protein
LALDGLDAERPAHVIAAGAPIVAREGVNHEPVWARLAEPDAQAAIARAMTGPGREHLTSDDFPAKRERQTSKAKHAAPPQSD